VPLAGSSHNSLERLKFTYGRGDNGSNLPEPSLPVSRQSEAPEPPLREGTKAVGPED
jgi:hypothetical protein